MKNLETKEQRKNRVIAQGEVSGHSHIVVGEATITKKDGKTIIDVTGPSAIKHLMEQPFVEEGLEVWTKEHADIPLQIGTYEYVPQREFNPYLQSYKRVVD
jgi:hypothetical protein